MCCTHLEHLLYIVAILDEDIAPSPDLTGPFPSSGGTAGRTEHFHFTTTLVKKTKKMFHSTNNCDLRFFKSLVPGEFTYRNLPTLPSNLKDMKGDMTIFLLADSTPSGCLRCVQFIVDFLADNDGTSVTFMRIKIPYSISPLTYMSSDAFLHPEFDPRGTSILGRVRWLASGRGVGDFSAYDVERLEIDDDDGLFWPIPYVPRLSHLKANGAHGNRPFLCPQLLSGLTYFQQFALSYAQINHRETTGHNGHLPTIHEIACVGVSRFGDLPLQDLVEQIIQLTSPVSDEEMVKVGALEVFRPKPGFSSVQCYEQFPYHLIPRTSTWAGDCKAVLGWLMSRCQQLAHPMQPAPIHVQPGKQTYCIGKSKVLEVADSLEEQLERWFQLKIDEILRIKRDHIEAWMDPSSQAFKEREFLRMLFVPNQKSKKFFWQETEQGKLDMLMEMFPGEPETWIQYLLHLPIQRVGPEVFTFLVGDIADDDGDQQQLDGEAGFVAYSQKTGRQLLEESLRQLQLKS